MNRPALTMTTDMGANARVEGRDAASSRTVPLDAVVGRHRG